MTNNENFAFLLKLTGLQNDFETLARLMKPYGIILSKTKVNDWIKNNSKISDYTLKTFQTMLFDIQKKADALGYGLFDLRNIIENMQQWQIENEEEKRMETITY